MHTVRTVAGRATAAAAVLWVAAGVAVPDGPLTDGALAVTGLLAAVAMAGAVAHHRPERAAPWLFLAAGVALQALGDAVFYVYLDVLHRDPFPSPADFLYLAGSPLKIMGMALLVRGRRSGRDREGLIDAAVFTVSASLVAWVFVIKPAVVASAAPLSAQALGLAYPVLDLLLLGLVIRLLTEGGARSPSFVLLILAGALLLVADYLFFFLEFTTDDHPVLIDDIYLVVYALWAAAALHPSMRRASRPAPEEGSILTPARLAALTAAGLAAPGVLVVQLTAGERLAAWAVAVSSGVLFGLVIGRMTLMLRKIEMQAQELSDLARTDGLTGLPNRRSADAELERRRTHAAHTGAELVVALVDLDRFKAFNDSRGHPEGDRLLTGCALAWRTVLQHAPVVIARYGGEEFLLIAVGRSATQVTDHLAEMRAAMPEEQTFSAGVATWNRAEPVQELVARADIALYAAKHAGRARTHTAPQPVPA